MHSYTPSSPVHSLLLPAFGQSSQVFPNHLFKTSSCLDYRFRPSGHVRFKIRRDGMVAALKVIRSKSLPIRRAISNPASHEGFSINMLVQSPPDIEQELRITESIESEVVEKKVAEIRRMLRERMVHGEISASPYDTAWVAFIREVDGSDGPRFPSSLRWIAEHQLPDGSWGDADFFEVHDRAMNTLACVLALTSYQVCADQCAKGMIFLRENMNLIGEGGEDSMSSGFEIAFLSLLDMARTVGLDLPFTTPGLEKVRKMRRSKMERIPKDLMHEAQTTLLHSLEGMVTGERCESNGLDWTRLLKLQCANGSFLFSPSSTAFAVIQTGDSKCLSYLEDIIERFGGGVPNTFPIDLLEPLWVVDRLQRLGVSRYFEPEIECCLDYVYKNWTVDGIGWASQSPIHDIDDTAMGFRLLRLHGYDVSPDVFHNFRREGEFQCFAGQSVQGVSDIFNLYRATHIAFEGEEVLEEARCFSRMFLRKKQINNQLIDKWIITKDLPGEVAYALDFPWHASLPRVEARLYLEQYGGGDVVWIAKTFYRMPLVNNNSYLELAKADFNMCQMLHQRELLGLRRWLDENGLGEHGVSGQWLMEAFFLASSSVFEPEKSAQRLGWTRTAVLMHAVRKLLRVHPQADEMKRNIVVGLRQCGSVTTSNSLMEDTFEWNKRTAFGALVRTLRETIHNISLEAVAAASATELKRHEIQQYLQQAWEEWVMTVDEEGNGDEALLLCRTLELCAGRYDLEEALSSRSRSSSWKSEADMTSESITNGDAPWRREDKYRQAAALTSTICHGLRQFHRQDGAIQGKTRGLGNDQEIYPLEMEMKKLLQWVLPSLNGESNETMQTFLVITKSFFYAAYCSRESMAVHISKVLFERVG